METFTYEVPERCPNCDLILLEGHIFDAARRADDLGPIFGITRDVSIDECRAAYVGLDGGMKYPHMVEMYLCPKCGTDPVQRIVHTDGPRAPRFKSLSGVSFVFIVCLLIFLNLALLLVNVLPLVSHGSGAGYTNHFGFPRIFLTIRGATDTESQFQFRPFLVNFATFLCVVLASIIAGRGVVSKRFTLRSLFLFVLILSYPLYTIGTSWLVDLFFAIQDMTPWGC